MLNKYLEKIALTYSVRDYDTPGGSVIMDKDEHKRFRKEYVKEVSHPITLGTTAVGAAGGTFAGLILASRFADKYKIPATIAGGVMGAAKGLSAAARSSHQAALRKVKGSD